MKPSFKLQLDKVNQQQPSPVKEAVVEDEGEKQPEEVKPGQVSPSPSINS